MQIAKVIQPLNLCKICKLFASRTSHCSFLSLIPSLFVFYFWFLHLLSYFVSTTIHFISIPLLCKAKASFVHAFHVGSFANSWIIYLMIWNIIKLNFSISSIRSKCMIDLLIVNISLGKHVNVFCNEFWKFVYVVNIVFKNKNCWPKEENWYLNDGWAKKVLWSAISPQHC